MKFFLLLSFLFSFSALAKIVTNEPRVNFNGTYVKITKTCLADHDDENLQTIEPVKVFGQVQMNGRRTTQYLGKKTLKTSVHYTVTGRCLRQGPKQCAEREIVSKDYPLQGSYDVFKTHLLNGKVTMKNYVQTVNYIVPFCQEAL